MISLSFSHYRSLAWLAFDYIGISLKIDIVAYWFTVVDRLLYTFVKKHDTRRTQLSRTSRTGHVRMHCHWYEYEDESRETIPTRTSRRALSENGCASLFTYDTNLVDQLNYNMMFDMSKIKVKLFGVSTYD